MSDSLRNLTEQAGRERSCSSLYSGLVEERTITFATDRELRKRVLMKGDPRVLKFIA